MPPVPVDALPFFEVLGTEHTEVWPAYDRLGLPRRSGRYDSAQAVVCFQPMILLGSLRSNQRRRLNSEGFALKDPWSKSPNQSAY